ncbi:unnamed protein product [Onchocerca flexuosa]|uniref:Uncharacterized protein n=1 Tax=Onchocerca flexuosa TaxID=387005 RepID=A0A183HHX4_9BILA|nr:unnamed protein product [Onchocerca flexuosa]
MRLEWTVLLLLLVLPIMIADIDASVGNENPAITVDKQYLPRSHRFKRVYDIYIDTWGFDFVGAVTDVNVMDEGDDFMKFYEIAINS